MIRVNGTTITDEQIAREVQYHPAPSLEAATLEASVALVVRELLLQEAAALGVAEEAPGADDRTVSEERTIALLLAREVRLPAASDEELRRYFEHNAERFRSPDLFEASHILFSAAPDDPEPRARALAAARATLEELRRDPGAFERIAKERSADPESRAQGGHLGQITRGQTTSEFEACLDRLEPGAICREPVETRYGFHIVRLDRAERGRPMTYSMAKERVAEYLGARTWTHAVRQYLQLLVGKADIEGIALDGATTPLVQ